MLRVAALEERDPVAELVLAEADDAVVHDCERWQAGGERRKAPTAVTALWYDT